MGQGMKRNLLLLVAVTLLACTDMPVVFAEKQTTINKETCSVIKDKKTFPLYGCVKLVEYNEDIKVELVEYGEDVKIKVVEHGSMDCGEVRIVEYNEDIKVRIVEFNADIKVRVVKYNPGIK